MLVYQRVERGEVKYHFLFKPIAIEYGLIMFHQDTKKNHGCTVEYDNLTFK
jgi:hypothetical protein